MPLIVMSDSSSLKAPKSIFHPLPLSITNFVSLIRFLFARVSYERDTKIINAASFTVEREDHTIGNILRM
jgi:hypothetical protein